MVSKLLSSPGGSGGDSSTAAPLKTYTETFNEIFPQYLSIGMTEEQYWDGDCQLVVAFRKADEKRYDALLLPGGRAPEFLRLNKKVVKLIKAFAESKKPIAAICHGPQMLTAADVIRGKKISAYPACKPEILAAGAEYADIELTGAVTDGNFVTAPAWTAHVEWLKQFIALINL